MASRIPLSFTPGEIISPGTVLKWHCHQSATSESARGAAHFHQHGSKIDVAISCEGSVISVEVPSTVEPGHYKLFIDEICDHTGSVLTQATIVPVVVGAMKGRVSEKERVEHCVHLACSGLSWTRMKPGKKPPRDHQYIEFAKVVNRDDGCMTIKAFDEDGKEIDGWAQLAEISRRRSEKFGCMSELLWNRLERSKVDDMVAVVILPEVSDLLLRLRDSTKGDGQGQPQEEREILALIDKERSATVTKLQSLGLEIEDGTVHAHFIYAKVSAKQARQISRMVGIESILFDDPSYQNDLGNSQAISHADEAHSLGYTGKGVNVAVFEDGPTNRTDLSFAGRYLNLPDSTVIDEHARLTSAIIKNVAPRQPNGYAPDCNLYSANSGDNLALTWATKTKACTVISQSFHRIDEQHTPEFSADDKLKDIIALSWPYPTIVQAAGNFFGTDTPPSDQSEYVNHKGYNTLIVGSHNDTATAIASSSVFRNARSNPGLILGGRELPNICANGEAVTAIGVTKSGTSFAAPAVAGAVAVIQSANSELQKLLATCRAILFASADRNVEGGTWWQDVQVRADGKDGAGALNVEAAVLIVQNKVPKDGAARKRGWNGGISGGGEFGPNGLSTYRYRIQVPSAPVGRLFKVKVALSHNSFIPFNAQGPLPGSSDFLGNTYDLLVWDDRGVQVANSSSFDNNYEIAEFFSPPDQEYAIVLRYQGGPLGIGAGILLGEVGVAWIVTGL